MINNFTAENKEEDPGATIKEEDLGATIKDRLADESVPTSAKRNDDLRKYKKFNARAICFRKLLAFCRE